MPAAFSQGNILLRSALTFVFMAAVSGKVVSHVRTWMLDVIRFSVLLWEADRFNLITLIMRGGAV